MAEENNADNKHEQAKFSVRPATEEEKAQTELWNEWGREVSSFSWYYDAKETSLILEGKATIKDKKGNEITIKSGDWVIFENGLQCVWEIESTIRKRYLIDS